jgi:hypothetical protein
MKHENNIHSISIEEMQHLTCWTVQHANLKWSFELNKGLSNLLQLCIPTASVCVCVCVRERERSGGEGERERFGVSKLSFLASSIAQSPKNCCVD